MTTRIPLTLANAIDEQRRLGRTDRQIEKVVGLPSGTLSRPYLIDDSEERQRAKIAQELVEWREQRRRFWASQSIPQRPKGWRPKGNCITDRPNAGSHFKPRKPA